MCYELIHHNYYCWLLPNPYFLFICIVVDLYKYKRHIIQKLSASISRCRKISITDFYKATFSHVLSSGGEKLVEGSRALCSSSHDDVIIAVTGSSPQYVLYTLNWQRNWPWCIDILESSREEVVERVES